MTIVIPATFDGSPIATSAAGASSSPIVRPTRRSGRRLPSAILREHRGVVVGGHAVAAEDLELARDHQVHRDRRRGVVAEHEPDLDVATALAQARDRVEARRRAAERVDREVRAAAGGLDDLRRRRQSRAPSTVARAERPAPRRARPARRRSATTRAPPATAIMTADSPTPPQPWTATHSPGCDPALADDRAVGGREAAAEAGRGDEVERRPGSADEVDVGPIDRDELGERAPVREAGLELVVADLLVAGEARLAARRRHRRTARSPGRRRRQSRDVGADRLDRARRTRGPGRAARRCPGRGPASRASRSGTGRSPRPG